MKFGNQSYDIVSEGGNYILQGLKTDFILVGAFAQHEKEAEHQARKNGNAYVDEDGDLQYDYDSDIIRSYMDDSAEQFIREWVDSGKQVIENAHNIN